MSREAHYVVEAREAYYVVEGVLGLPWPVREGGGGSIGREVAEGED
jgi:hypothetical protein